jgi:sortase A
MLGVMKIVERLLWVSGLLMIGFYLSQVGLQEFERNHALAAYKSQHNLQNDPRTGPGNVPSAASLPSLAVDGPAGPAQAVDVAVTASSIAPTPDQSLWSAGRIAAFAASLDQQTSPVLGVFEIPALGLELPIYDGASELHMDRGIARIEGTAMPGHEDGNLGIAGHRDGYFRVLKDIGFGDEINVTTPGGTDTYIVEQLMIVDPSAVEVLDYTPVPSITLVTCYPFYYVGHAPERFVVRAVLQENT